MDAFHEAHFFAAAWDSSSHVQLPVFGSCLGKNEKYKITTNAHVTKTQEIQPRIHLSSIPWLDLSSVSGYSCKHKHIVSFSLTAYHFFSTHMYIPICTVPASHRRRVRLSRAETPLLLLQLRSPVSPICGGGYKEKGSKEEGAQMWLDNWQVELILFQLTT